MSSNAVAVIAIIAGVVMGVVGPIVTEALRRGGARRDLMHSQRIDAYADLLQVLARLHDNSATWTYDPLAALEETDDEKLNEIMARIDVVASPEVDRRVQEYRSMIHVFNFHHRFVSVPDAKSSHRKALREKLRDAGIRPEPSKGSDDPLDDNWSPDPQELQALLVKEIKQKYLEIRKAVRADIAARRTERRARL